MFKFLKEKLKNVVNKFGRKIEEEGVEEVVEEEIKEEVEEPIKEEIKKEPEKEITKEKVPTIHELAQRKKKKEKEKEKKEEEIKIIEEKEEEKKPTAVQILKEVEEPKKEVSAQELIEKAEEEIKPEEEAKGFFKRLKQKIITKRINEKQFDEIFWDLEVALMENNVAIEVIDKIKSDLKSDLIDKPIRRGKISEVIENSLKNSILGLFAVEKLDLLNEIKSFREKEKKPFIICFSGINGSGKTTSIAKFVRLLQKQNLTPVIAAADTFRAAAIQQLEEHGSRLNVKVIKHDYGADAAAVAFDTVKYAEAHNLDVVLIDTAGRMHSNVNLMDELKKVIRVNNPNLNIFVGESITGNDCVDQARRFNEAVKIDGIILTKADIDEKGGAAISVSYVTKKPIIYLGVGQNYDDLEEFDKDKIIKSLGFE